MLTVIPRGARAPDPRVKVSRRVVPGPRRPTGSAMVSLETRPSVSMAQRQVALRKAALRKAAW